MPPVYVLIGGRSERFGSDKATFPVDREPWALHVGRRLAGGGDLTLVGSIDDPSALADARLIPDAPDAAGPVGGLLAALEDRQTRLGDGRLVVASCDLVRPTPEWCAPLIEALDRAPTAVVAAYHAQERWQPFPMIADTRWLDAERPSGGALQAWLDASATACVTWSGPGDAPPQANRRSDLPDDASHA